MTNFNQEVQNHIEEIKSRIDVRQYAIDRFGVQVGSSDKALCFLPGHQDKNPSLHFYTNGYFCFSCKGAGDSLALFLHFNPDAKFLDAVDDSAQYVGMPPCPRTGWTQEDHDLYRAEIGEKQKIQEIHLAAVKYYAGILAGSDFAKADIKRRWGLSEEFWTSKMMGYSTASKTDLLNHLRGLGYTVDDVIKSGLAKRNKDEVSDHFRGRIIFPYWSSGKVTYLIGRQTDETPKHPKFGPSGEVIEWVASNNKYKKLPVWRDDKDCQVSKHVQNPLYGIDALRDARIQEIVVTEGIADAYMAEQYGIPVVSPVTIRLKKSDCDKYVDLFKRKSKIYIINDNEENKSGENGALDMADFLESAGCRVLIGVIPRPDGVEKIDLADLLHNSTDPKAAFEEVKRSARIPLIHRIMSIDKGADEMERTEHILSSKESWGRVQPAFLPTILGMIKDHFGIDAKQRDALESSIKKIMKEEEKKNKANADAASSDDSSASNADLPLAQRVALELEASDSGLELTANRAKDWIIEWLKNNGAKFYVLKDREVGLIYFRRKLYEDGKTSYHVMMDNIACLNIKSRAHQLILQYISTYLLQEGKPIIDFSWISTTETGVKYMSLSGNEDDNLICMDKDSPSIKIMPNANNEHNVVLRSPYFLKQVKYDETADIQEAFQLYEKYIFNNLACSTRDRYLVTAWSMLSLLLDELETRPILQCTGSASSGKTTSAKLLSTLLFGEQRHESGSTMAATNDLSNNVPCLYMDNQEQRNISDSLMEFLIASATKASRNKKGSLHAGDIVKQSPNCMTLITSIEYFSRKELIERILVVNFDEAHQKGSFSEGRVLRLIRNNRDKIISALLKVAHLVYRRLYDEEMYDLVEEQIRNNNPINSKQRNMDALVYMTCFMQEICKYIHHNFDGIKFEAANSDSIHYLIMQEIISNQNTIHSENTEGSSKINYFLSILQKIWDNKQIEQDGNAWAIADAGKVRDFVDKYLVEFRCWDGIKYLLVSYSDLHGAFSRISNPAIPYDITSPTNLRARIKDGYKVMMGACWYVGLNARRSNSDRQHVFVRAKSDSDITKLKEKYPDLTWVHESKLKVVQDI